MAGYWQSSFFECLWTLQKDNLANISSLDRAILIRNPYLYALNSKGRNALEIFAGDEISPDRRIQSPCVSLAWCYHDLPALRLSFHVEILKNNFQSCALWNRNHIETVRAILIVVWITRTFQSVVYNLATSY